MSNLLKGFYTKESEERVIDYNAVISEKIETIRAKMEKSRVEADGFQSGLNPSVVEGLISDGEEGEQDEEGMEEGAFQSLVAERIDLPSMSADDIKELAGNILEDANEKAEAILEDARREAEAIKQNALEEAMHEGFEKGYEEGVAKADAEYQNLINDANNELARLEQEYTTRYNSMESDLVNVLLEIFSKVTYTVSEDNKEIILHLINRVMSDIECSGDILIHVSKDDYQFLIDNQGKIYCASQKDININVLEDSSLMKNQCIIETDGGVFNCSLDIQLEELIRNIRLLSCV